MNDKEQFLIEYRNLCHKYNVGIGANIEFDDNDVYIRTFESIEAISEHLKILEKRM